MTNGGIVKINVQYEMARLLYIFDHLIGFDKERLYNVIRYAKHWDEYEKYKDVEHHGSCVKEPAACSTCLYEEYMNDAKEVMEKGFEKWWEGDPDED